jgi:hypothetical protein
MAKQKKQDDFLKQLFDAATQKQLAAIAGFVRGKPCYSAREPGAFEKTASAKYKPRGR